MARSSVLEQLRSRGVVGAERYARELGELQSSFERTAVRFGAERLPSFTDLMGAGAERCA